MATATGSVRVAWNAAEWMKGIAGSALVRRTLVQALRSEAHRIDLGDLTTRVSEHRDLAARMGGACSTSNATTRPGALWRARPASSSSFSDQGAFLNMPPWTLHIDAEARAAAR